MRRYRIVIPERTDDEPHVIVASALPPFRRRVVARRRFVICRADLEAWPAFSWDTLNTTVTALLVDDRQVLLQVSAAAGDSDAYIAALPDTARRHLDLDYRPTLISHWAGL